MYVYIRDSFKTINLVLKHANVNNNFLFGLPSSDFKL